MDTNKIFLTPGSMATKYEEPADAAINPGYLVEETGTGVVANSTADEVTPAVLIADVNVGDAGTVDRAYITNETVSYRAAMKGERVALKIADSVVITKGDKLASAGDGTLIVATIAGSAIAQARETITGSGETFIDTRIL